MTKFKVGDKVRCKISSISFNEGQIYEVNEVDSDGWIKIAGYPHKIADCKRFEFVEEEAPACVMTQDQFAALKTSLENLRFSLSGIWEHKNEKLQCPVSDFFEEMEAQGLLSDPKPKTAQEIAQEALSNLNERLSWVPYNPDSNESKMKAALQQIAKGEQS